MKDGSLSLNAKNIKIIVREGKVLLRGPVDSQQEKDTIGTKAGEIAGKDKADNQLEVKAKQQQTTISLKPHSNKNRKINYYEAFRIMSRDTEEHAATIVEKLKSAGFSDNDISVLFPDKGSTRDFAHKKETKMPEGATIGASTGGAVGGTIGLLAVSVH
jgi:BON domain